MLLVDIHIQNTFYFHFRIFQDTLIKKMFYDDEEFDDGEVYDDSDEEFDDGEFYDDDYEQFSYGEVSDDDEDLFNSAEEKKFAGLRNEITDIDPSDVHLQSGNKNIDDRYRLLINTYRSGPTLTDQATSHFGDFIVSYLFTTSLDRKVMSTTSSSYYISEQNLNPTSQSECTALSKLFVGNIHPSVTCVQVRKCFADRDYSVKKVYLKKNRVCT